MHARKKLMLVLLLLLFIPNAEIAAGESGASSWRSGTEVHISNDEVIAEPLNVAGVSVTFEGITQNDITLAGMNVSFGGIAEKKVTVIGAHADLPGTFQDSLACYAANVVLSGTYNGDISVRAANLTITPAARINGNLFYATASVKGLEHADIQGTVTQIQIDAPEREMQRLAETMKKIATAASIGYWFLSLAGIILTGILLHAFFPGITGHVLSTMSDASRASIGTGFTALVAVPVASLLLALTVAGIPVAAICMVSYGVLLYISQAYSSMWLGKKILHRNNLPQRPASIPDLLSGALTLWIIGIIPVLGWLLNLFLCMLAMGALLQIIWQSIVDNRNKLSQASAN